MESGFISQIPLDLFYHVMWCRLNWMDLLSLKLVNRKSRDWVDQFILKYQITPRYNYWKAPEFAFIHDMRYLDVNYDTERLLRLMRPGSFIFAGYYNDMKIKKISAYYVKDDFFHGIRLELTRHNPKIIVKPEGYAIEYSANKTTLRTDLRKICTHLLENQRLF